MSVSTILLIVFLEVFGLYSFFSYMGWQTHPVVVLIYALAAIGCGFALMVRS